MLQQAKTFFFMTAALSAALFSCAQKNKSPKAVTAEAPAMGTTASSKPKPEMTPTLDTITLGAGCFWCVEAVFQQLNGVEKVVSGYSGGHVENPSYDEICGKETGHAEVCRLYFDPAKVTVAEILEVYWQTHDPTTLNRQGADAGPQYRSVIFYHNQQQKEVAEQYKTELDKSGAFDNPIVTAIEPLKNFYPAEDYHQNYYRTNPNQGYCSYVIRPKVEKFQKVFKDKMKKQ